jgi:hypothetical protein
MGRLLEALGGDTFGLMAEGGLKGCAGYESASAESGEIYNSVPQK